MRFGGCGFKANGRLGATKIEVVFSFVFETHSEALFSVPNRIVAPFGVHFGVIFRSFWCLFLNILFFEKHAFRLDETIVFEVLEGSSYVLFS